MDLAKKAYVYCLSLPWGPCHNPTQQHHSPNPSTSASSSRVDINAETSYPPVPPVPAAYASQKQRPYTPLSTTTDIFSLSESSRASAASPVIGPHNRKSKTPTPSTMSERRGSQASAMITDKPLPSVRDNVDGHDSTPMTTTSKRESSSHDARDPASVSEGETPSRSASSSSRRVVPSPSPATAAITSFSDDMAGMLANIGQSEPAMELGLPPERLRRKDDKNRFSAVLGKPLSDKEPVSATLTSSTFLSVASSPQRSASLPVASASEQASSMTLKGSSAAQLSSFLDPPIFQPSTFLNHELFSHHPQQPQKRHHTKPCIKLHASSSSPSSATAPSVDIPKIASIFETTGNGDQKGENAWQASSEGPSPLLPSSAKFDSSLGVESTDRPSPSPIASSAWARQAQESPASWPSARLQPSFSDRIDKASVPASSSATSGVNSLSAQGAKKDTQDEVVKVISSRPGTPSKAQEQAVRASSTDKQLESKKDSELGREQEELGEETNEEKGKRLAREFYEGNGTTVASEKMAEFLGGP